MSAQQGYTCAYTLPLSSSWKVKCRISTRGGVHDVIFLGYTCQPQKEGGKRAKSKHNWRSIPKPSLQLLTRVGLLKLPFSKKLHRSHVQSYPSAHWVGRQGESLDRRFESVKTGFPTRGYTNIIIRARTMRKKGRYHYDNYY